MLKSFLCFVLSLSCVECSVWVKELEAPVVKEDAGKPFSFASYYENHMVFQAAPQQAVIWGYNTPDTIGQVVTLYIPELGKKYTAVVGPDYKWLVKLDPVDAGGPYALMAMSGDKRIGLQDVLFGDVWVCSGQSNMKFPLAEIFNSTEEIKDAVNYPNIRVFIAAEKESTTPLDDLGEDGIYQQWSLPAAGNFSQFSAVCWLYGKYLYQHLKKPLGLIDTAWGGTPVEAWSSPDALARCGLSITNSEPKPVSPHSVLKSDDKALVYDGITGPQESSVLWNAMIHPFLNMTIYGAIWYQGENNVNLNMNLYNCTFPAMIDDWRKKFHQSGGSTAYFPFGFVQLATKSPTRSVKIGLPDIRWHQTADYGYVPNHRLRKVFMAVTMDLPDFRSPFGAIHPRDKQDVAHRLVLSSLAVAYDQSVVYQGPFPVHLTTEDWVFGAKVQIIYSSPVEERNFEGFEICCSLVDPPACTPGKSWWIPEPVVFDSPKINSSVSTLLIEDCKKHHIVGIRYAWSESPCAFKKCAIYGKDSELPGPPFTFSGEEFLTLHHP